MKKLLATILCVFLLVSVFSAGVLSISAQENTEQTEETIPINAIAINSVWELSMICNEYPADGYYYLTTDLDMAEDVAQNGDFYDDGKGWTPIGTQSFPFTGTFNGQGHTIKNVKIDRTMDYVGLFGNVSGARIFDLTMEDSAVTGGNYTAGVIGNAADATIYDLQVKNCEIKGSSNYAGGIVGRGTNSSLHDCALISGTVNVSKAYCGGIAGYLSAAGEDVTNCTNDGDITAGKGYAGGLFGSLSGTPLLDNCRNTGDVSAQEQYVGGVVGDASSVTVQNCENTGNVKTVKALCANATGGIAGSAETVADSVNRGNVNAQLIESRDGFSGESSQSSGFAGGIVGQATNVLRCFNTGAVYVSGGRHHDYYNVSSVGGFITIRHADYYTYGGGIAGKASSVESCYNAGSVTGKEENVAAAIVSCASWNTSVRDCYSDANTMYLVRCSSNSTITNCYNANGPIAKKGTATNCYYYAEAESGLGGLRTKRQLRAAINYVDWDFETVWTFGGNEDYLFPELIDLPSEFVKRPVSIVLLNTPEKTTYLEGKEVLDITGLKIKVTYDNETNEQLDVTEDMVSGFNNNVVGTKTVTVTYGGFTDEFSVVVVAKSLSSVEMATLPEKLQYLEQKDEFDITGATLRLNYNNDTYQLIDVTADMVSGFDNAIVGPQTITVSYSGKETTFDVEVMPKSVVSIETLRLPEKLAYIEGDVLDLTGGIITVNYDNDTSEQKDMADCQASLTDLTAFGTNTITISYENFEISFDVDVAHAYHEQYAWNNDGHWLECDCGGVSATQEHLFDHDCDTDCNVCDFTRTITHVYTADCDAACDVCGDLRTALAEHVYTNDCDANCNICESIRNVPDHVYDNACDTDCNVCGLTRSVPDHVYDNACDTDCNACGLTRSVPDHVYDNACDIDCNACGLTRTVPDHVYDNACDTDCNVCGLTRSVPDHVYDTACDTDCNVCGLTRSVPDHVYDNACDADCNICGLERTPEVHKVISDRYSFINSTTYPFVQVDDYYTSTNKGHSTTAIAILNVLGSGQITIYYSTSTEANYDKLTIKHNSTTILTKSGSTSVASITIDVAAGDTISIAYSKDGSVSNGSDTVRFKIDSVERVIPADEVEPTCTEAVVCSVCGVTVKEALGHTYSGICDENCNTCGGTHVGPNHSYDNACDSDCNVCGADRTVPDHVYSYACDASCNICGFERTASAHMVTAGDYVFTNSTSYPFALSEGVYNSTNKGNSTTSTCKLTALGDGVFKISYYTSTESGYDKLIIKHNSTTKVTVSGETSWATIAINVQEGDTISISYSKDVSTARGNDAVYFKVDLVECVIPADQATAICKNALTCVDCGQVVKAALAHTYDNKCDKTCNVCAATRTVGAHKYTNACDKYCNYCKAKRTTKHVYTDSCDTTCNVCNATRSIKHTYSNACDGSCNVCGATRTPADHVYSNACDGSCNVCGATRTPAAHVFDNRCDKTCNVCGAIRTVGAHKYTNACDKYCNYCKAKRTTKHTYTNSCDKVCNICSATRGITHTYSNSCDKVCNICSATRSIKHTYSNNCDKTCNVCGATRTVGAHKYTNSCDRYCNYCNAKRTIKHTYTNSCDTTCNVCSATRSITHKYKSITTRATLTKNGSIVKKCSVCGSVASTTTIRYAKTFTLSTTKYEYNGTVRKPSITVKDSAGNTLKVGTDYKVKYPSGCKGVGSYKVTITMIGKYSGTKTLTYTIVPTTKTSASMMIGDTYSIGAKSNKTITYASSNKSIATVSSKGVITGLKAGKVTITVTSGTASQKITVTVKKPTVTISAPASTLYIGKTMKLSATTNPAGATVTWSVSNKSLAAITSSGTLKGEAKGTVTVTAKMTYKGKTYSSTYKVTIDVEYPDVSVFISEDSDYTSSYAFIITNNSSGSLKIYNRGDVYCNGTTEYIDALYIGDGQFYEWVSLKAGKSATMVASLENKMLFLSSKTVWMDLYVEYNGETFMLSCRSSISGLNKCYNITWVQS